MPKIHEQDTIKVRNIDTGTDCIISDITKKPHTVKDEEGKAIYTEYEEVEEEFNPKNGFRVKWGGKWHTILPGQYKFMPRFLAEHYASHLADFVCGLRGVNPSDKRSRAKIIDLILEGVVSFYEGDEEQDDGEDAFAQVEQLNRGRKEPKSLDLGEFDDEHVIRTVRVDGDGSEPMEEEEQPELQDLPPIEQPKTPENNTTPRINDPSNKPSVEELRAELEGMGETVTGKESQDDLIKMLKSFT